MHAFADVRRFSSVPRILGWVALTVVMAWPSVTGLAAQATGETLTGWLTLVWTEGQPADPFEHRPQSDTLVLFTSDDGVVRRLDLSPALVGKVGGRCCGSIAVASW